MIGTYIIFFVFCIVSLFYKIQWQKQVKDTLLTKADSVAVKGMAALCVMLAHYASWMEGYFHRKLSIVFLIFKQLGGIGVLLFFFLSGYGIYFSSIKKDMNFKWLVRKVCNVYIPYFFMKLVLEIINYFVVPKGSFSLLIFFKTIIGLDFGDWFIFVIILQYIIFGIAWKIAEKKRITVTFWLSIVLMAFFIWKGAAPRWYNGLLLFWFGCIVAKYEKKIMVSLKRNYWMKLCVLLTGFIATSVLYLFSKGIIILESIKIISGMLLGIILIAVLMKISFKSPVLAWIGKRSLYIYIIHVNLWSILCNRVTDGNVVLPLAICTSFLVSEMCYEGYSCLGIMIKKARGNYG